MQEIQGSPYKVLVPEKERADFEKIWEKVLTGETYQAKVTNVSKDGREIHLSSSYIPVKDKEGTINKILYLAIKKED